jgi:hypothetical protein
MEDLLIASLNTERKEQSSFEDLLHKWVKEEPEQTLNLTSYNIKVQEEDVQMSPLKSSRTKVTDREDLLDEFLKKLEEVQRME